MPVRKQVAQLGFRAPRVRFHGTERHCQHIGYLIVAQSKLHNVQKHDPLGRGQVANRALYIKPQLDRFVWRCSLVERVAIDASRRTFSVELKKAGISDAVKPCGKTCLAAKLMQFAPCQQEGLLGEIIGIGIVIIKEPAQLRTHHALMAPQKLFERKPIIRQLNTGHQSIVDLRWSRRVSHAFHRAG